MAHNGFDFNKAFSEGIGYVRQSEAKLLRQKCEQSVIKKEASARNFTTFRRQLDELTNKVDTWVESNRHSGVAAVLNLTVTSYSLRKALVKHVIKLYAKAGFTIDIEPINGSSSVVLKKTKAAAAGARQRKPARNDL